jgi:hypothetical protein
MYFKVSMRHNPGSGKHEGYYRLVESYRNEQDRVCHRTLLNVGFLDGVVTIDQLNLIRRKLVNRYQRALGQTQIEFEEEERIEAEPVVNRFVEELWEKLVSEKRIDTGQKEAKKNGNDTYHQSCGLSGIGTEDQPLDTGKLGKKGGIKQEHKVLERVGGLKQKCPSVQRYYDISYEVEADIRCLKTDLDLRPIYHKNDDSTMAYLHLGLLAYWVVNTSG